MRDREIDEVDGEAFDALMDSLPGGTRKRVLRDLYGPKSGAVATGGPRSIPTPTGAHVSQSKSILSVAMVGSLVVVAFICGLIALVVLTICNAIMYYFTGRHIEDIIAPISSKRG